MRDRRQPLTLLIRKSDRDPIVRAAIIQRLLTPDQIYAAERRLNRNVQLLRDGFLLISIQIDGVSRIAFWVNWTAPEEYGSQTRVP